jgi:WD40 repeat protein/serine/threonine protein kinase
MIDALPEILFAAWAVRVEGGEALDCADLLRAHPEHVVELRRLHEDWKLFAPLLGKVVPGLLASGAGIVVAPLSVDDQDAREMPSSEMLERLRIEVPNSGRYRFRAVIGCGGGGVVLKVWDTKLSRPLAMKVVLGQGEDRLRCDSRAVDGRSLARFADEARIASQLDHPGIVPVHELGADDAGRAFFTMKLVKGEDLSLVFDHVATGHDGWNQTRALGVLLRVCEAMSYAHAKHVIHRDLKPANVMVGPYGEVYVMDWGLARVVGEKDPHDLRIRPPAPRAARTVASLRHPDGDATPQSPLVTMDGTVVGTPAYMSPEQARGEIEKLSARSDVYSIGSMLYHLLARRSPYTGPGLPATNHAVLALVLQGPPAALTSLRKDVPAELAAICEKAMARESEERYADMAALAADLRAYLEHHVVGAFEAGAWAEARKWVQRNKPLAASVAAAVLVIVGGTALFLTALQSKNTELATKNSALDSAGRVARQNETDARRVEGLAKVEETKARALALANASKAAESSDPMRALLLAREAAYVEMSPAVVSQLHSALVGSLEEVVFSGHKGRLAPAVFSPDGKLVLTASGDHTAQIWKSDGRAIVTLSGHERSLYAAVFSPTGDRILTASEDGTACLWSPEGTELRRLTGHTDTINAVAYSPQGDRIVTGSFDGTARLWDAEGNPLAVLVGHTRRLTCVAWSPKGERVATASEDGDVRVWDAQGVLLALLPHRSPVWAIAFSPSDGQLLLTGTEDGVSSLWDVALEQQTVIGSRTRAVKSVAFSRVGDVFATSAGNTVNLWNTRDALAVHQVPEGPFAELRGHTNEVCWTEFSSDGQLIATAGSADRTARVWDLQGRSVAVLRGHSGPVCSVRFAPDFTPDRGFLLTASGDGTARTWRLKGAEIATYRSVKYGMHALAVCGCGQERVLAVPDEGPALLLDKNGKKTNEYGGAKDRLHSAKFSSDVKRVVISDESGWVRVYELNGKQPVYSFETHSPGCWADFSPSGTEILTWSDDAAARLWDLEGNPIRTFDEHEDRVRSAAFSPQGDLIVTGSWDRRIWNAQTGKLIRTLVGHGQTVTSAVFSHDGKKVLTAGGADQTATIWDLDGQPLHHWMHASSANVAAFSNDDSRVAVGCGDGSTWLWDVANDRLMAQMPGHTAGVIAAEFEHDDASLATACTDGNVRVRSTRGADVLRLVDKKITRAFTHAEIVEYQALLDHKYDDLQAAYDYVEPRLALAVVVDQVEAATRAEPLLKENVRLAALGVLARMYDDPEHLRVCTWECVREKGRPAEEYERARDWAGTADEISHENLFTRVLLGVAQHRTGDECAALRTLEAVDSQLGDASPWTQLTCLGALALVQHALGEDDKSRADMARFERLSCTLTERVPYRFREFLDEARALEQ